MNHVVITIFIISACLFGLIGTDSIDINNRSEPIPSATTIDTDTGDKISTIAPNSTSTVPPTSTTTTTTTTIPPPTSITTTTSTPPTSSTTKPTSSLPTTPITTPTTSTTSSTPTTSTSKPTATPTSSPPTTPVPSHRRFDGPSFIGGIVLALGLVAIGFVAFKFYKARTELNYHTL